MAWKLRVKDRERNLAEATLPAASASTIWERERTLGEVSEARVMAEKSRRADRQREVLEAVTAAKNDFASVGVRLVAIDGETGDYLA